MIRDDWALDVEVVPSELHHREGAIDHVSTCLRPIAQGRSGMDALITGPPGAGKTTLARYVMDEFETEYTAVRTGEIDCFSVTTQTDALHTLLDDLGLATWPRESTSSGKCLDALRDVGDPVVVLIDEVDAVPDPGLIASLSRIEGVTLLMACVDEDSLLSGVGRRIESRLRSSRTVPLSGYSQEALEDIILARADVALTSGAADARTVSHIADLAAGNARQAIMLLKWTAEAAEQRGTTALSPGLVDAVADDAVDDVREHNISRLGTYHRLLFDIVRESGEIAAGELHDEFERRADSPVTESQRRRYLHALRKYDLIEAVGATSNRVYRLADT